MRVGIAKTIVLPTTRHDPSPNFIVAHSDDAWLPDWSSLGARLTTCDDMLFLEFKETDNW